MMDKDTKLQWSQSSVKSVPFPEAGSNNGLRKYINAVYDATEKARTSALEDAYRKNVDNIKAAQEKAKGAYADTASQIAASAAQQNSAYRQIANANNLTPNTSGQAALMQNNAAQADMAKLRGNQSLVQTQINMQKDLLERNRQYDMQRVLAENENERNRALYEEAVRMDNVRLQQRQFEQQQNNSMFQAKLNKAVAQKEAEAKAAAAAARRGSGGTPTRGDFLAGLYGEFGEGATKYVQVDGAWYKVTPEGYEPIEQSDVFGAIGSGYTSPTQTTQGNVTLPQGYGYYGTGSLLPPLGQEVYGLTRR